MVPGSSSSFESGRAIKWKDSADCRTLRIHNTSNQITIPDIDDCAERCLARASCLYFNMLDDPTNVCVLYESSPWEIPLKFEWKESRYNLRCGIIVNRDISTVSYVPKALSNGKISIIIELISSIFLTELETCSIVYPSFY